jgi:hypothetical protein
LPKKTLPQTIYAGLDDDGEVDMSRELNEVVREEETIVGTYKLVSTQTMQKVVKVVED